MSIYLRNDTYHYDFIIGGERYRGSTGITAGTKDAKKKAKEKEAERKVQVREGHSVEMIWEQTKRKMIQSNNIDMTNDEVWKAFSKHVMSDAGSTRMQIYSSHIKGFVEWINSKYPEARTMAKVTDIHAKEYMKALRDAPGANSTKNDKLATLKMLFEELGTAAGIVENPFKDIKKLDMNKIPREAFTIQELKLIGENATGWIYSLCLTALSTGLREGDICLLKKSSVNLETGWISIAQIRKTNKPLEIPIMPKLAQHLRLSIQNNESEYVYPELAKLYLSSDPSDIGKAVKKFFTEIGITDALKPVDGYVKNISAKDIHSFRHTFVYLAALNGIPFPIVQSIVGHASPAMTKMYMDHAGREAKAKYFGQLPEYLAGSITPKRELTTSRIKRMILKLTPDNLAKNKKRILRLLS